MKTLQEIQERLAQIDEELRKEGITIEEVRKLQAEIKELNAAKEEIRKAAEQAAETRRMIADGTVPVTVLQSRNNGQEAQKRTFAVDSVEYRDAYLKNLMGKPLDAEVTLSFADPAEAEALRNADLKTLFIVSKVDLTTGSAEGYQGEVPGLTVTVRPSEEPKCGRCWIHDKAVNEEGLCPRCAAVLSE